MGAEGIKDLLEAIDIDARHRARLRNDLTGSEPKIKKNAKRLKVLEAFQKIWHQARLDGAGSAAGAAAGPAPAGAAGRWPLRHLRPERPVPPRHQPQQPSARLLELKAPEIIARNEKRMLQEAVDACWTTAAAARP